MPQIQERCSVCMPYLPASGIMLFISFAFSVWLFRVCILFFYKATQTHSHVHREMDRYRYTTFSGDCVSCTVIAITGATLGNV